MAAADLLELAIIIPAYNEEGAIAATIESVRFELGNVPIFVCDNNSADATAAEARSAGAVVVTEYKKGKGNAVRRLLQHVNASIYVLVDGDNTYCLKSLRPALQLFQDEGYALMTGNRRWSEASYMRRGHGAGNWLFSSFLRYVVGIETSDVFSGLRIIYRKLICSFPMISTEFEIETELTVFASRMKLPQKDFPSSVSARVGTASKLNTLRDGLKILFFVFRTVHREYPFKIYLPMSAIIFSICLISITSLYIEFMQTSVVARLPTLIVTCIGFLMSILFIVLGLILRELSNSRYESRYFAYINSLS